MEKLSIEAGNKIRAETGAEPDPAAVADLVRGAWSQSQGNPREAWREILTPEEQIAVADRYIARELAAENFDAVFKNLGASLQDQPGVIPALARIVGKTVEAFGGEPLATRTSEFGAVPLRTPVVEAVRGAVTSRKPVVTPKPEVAPAPRTPVTTSSPADEAKVIADAAPEAIPVGGTKSPRELLGAVAEAIATQSGVKINYLSAPGEPAAATTSNRAARREIIETFRTMPPEARALWEKTFFPERIFKRKDKYQIFGWAPEVFASNAHKMAAALKDTTLSPYPIDPATGSFTEAGWKQLFDDTQTFVRNQMAGQTGAGETLIVPKTSQPGIFAPASRPAESVLIDQTKADFINMLFNSRLPDTPRLTKGKPSLNIAGQEVSEATKPGRVQKPVVARDPFAGPEAEARGIAGREILEVNPLRNEITAALGDKMPSLIEANQLLNLENIKEVTGAPEQPQFRANTLTLAAGFQPRPEEPRAIRSAAVKFPSGKVYEGPMHSIATDNGIIAGELPGFKSFDDLHKLPLPEYAKFFTSLEDGFVTNGGEFLNREQSFQRAQELQQLTNEDAKRLEQSVGIPALESREFDMRRQYQPIAEKAQSIKDMTDEQWSRDVQNFKGTLGSGPTGWGFDLGSKVKTADDVAALKTATESLQEITRAALKEKDFDTMGRLATRQQIAHEAYQAATGEKLDGTPAAIDFIRRHYKPDYQPPMPGESFKKWDAAQPDAAERAALEKQFDIPPESDKVSRMAAQPIRYDDAETVPMDHGSQKRFMRALDTAREDRFNLKYDAISAKFGGDGINISYKRRKHTEENLSKLLEANSAVLVLNPDVTPDSYGVSGTIKLLEGGEPVPKQDSRKLFVVPGGGPAVATGGGKGPEVFQAQPHRSIRRADIQPGRHRLAEVKTGGKGNTRLSDPDDLAIAAESLVSGEPINLDDFTSRAAQQDFFSGTEALSNSEVGRMSNAELKRRYPEAIVPASKEESIPSEIVNSPLYKSAGSEAQAVKAFSRRLVEFAKEHQDRPEYKLGAKWYSEFVPKLKQEFGKDAPIMAELLAATSPQTNVETNFGYALDALESMKAGRFNKIIDKYNQGLDMLANDKWESWYKRNLKDIPNPPAEPTPAAFLAHWIETHNLKPRQSNGKLYGQHSLAVLQVLARRWLDSARGPKTLNFVQNLLGTGHEATIDLWADRTMRRIGYEGYQPRWRILPHNNAAVSDADFSFAQQAFRQAAKELDMKPDALQGALWFAEKSHWADKGWSRLSLGDFSREMEKVPMLRAGYRQRLDKTQRSAKVKPAEEQELLIQPRKTK
jgi:hypothetical protein